MLTTIGEARRAVLRETLGTTIAWAIDRATSAGWDRERIEEYLQLPQGEPPAMLGWLLVFDVYGSVACLLRQAMRASRGWGSAGNRRRP